MHFQDLIIDIQGHDSIFDGDPDEFKSQVVRSFQSMSPTLDFPSFLLAYDEEGLKLFDDMQINSKWYYPFAAEKEILEVHGRDIVSTMLSRCTGDENASGTQIMLILHPSSLRKSTILLGALAEELDARLAAPSMSYLALDLQKNELVRTLGDLLSSSVGVALKGRVNIRGLVGTYKGSIRFVEKGGLPGAPHP